LKTALKLSASQHCHPAILAHSKNVAVKPVHENLLFFHNDDYQFTFNDPSSSVNFVNNGTLNSYVVNFDNFFENTFKIWPTPQNRSDYRDSRSSCSSIPTKCPDYLI